MQQSVTFASGKTDYIFYRRDAYARPSFEQLMHVYHAQNVILITDEHIVKQYEQQLKGYKVLTVAPHENSKDLHTIGALARQLLELQADKSTLLIGIGGGVVTDIVGFLASVYMRGMPFGFVPTTLLGMVDAAIGGKNGVNLGFTKNLLGTITQPTFIFFDTAFLETLPNVEWSNGFAEIIKYACIFDASLFDELNANSISFYKDNNEELIALVEKCVNLKNKVVLADERDAGMRKLLNFGHTAAHAIEKMYELPHGKAVAIGMTIACMISEKVCALERGATERVKTLLQHYHLPVSHVINVATAMQILRADKKRHGDAVDYIVLEKIGQGAVRSLPFDIIENALKEYASHS